MVSIKVNEENCKDCEVFSTSKFKQNMLDNNICGKRDSVGCPKDNNKRG